MTDFTTVTETWGLPASPEQLTMQHLRYRTLREIATGGRVLEIGCGTGMALGYLAESAELVVGGDYTHGLLREAKDHLPDSAVVRMDAQSLPFEDGAFDAVAMLEMLYYVPDQEAAFRECRRVLRPGGTLFTCMPNPDRPDFNPSPFANRYLDIPGLAAMHRSTGFEVKVFGGFPVDASSARDSRLAPLRRLAVRYRLIPRSMRLKSVVKRALYGRLPKMGDLRERDLEVPSLVEVDAELKNPGFKNIYAMGTAI